MILGLYQAPSPAGDIGAGLTTVETALSAAHDASVDMLTLPEAFLPGYNAANAAPPDGWDDIEPRLKELCTRYKTGLTIGLPEYRDGRVFNTALALSAEGARLARYDKIQLFGPNEAALYTPGNGYVTFDYLGTRFGLLICYDVEFPEHVRALKRMGATVILVPTANMMPFVNVNHLIAPARAAENALTIVYANYCGSEGALDYVGLSAILGPDGYQLGSKGQDAGLCIAELPNDDGWSEHAIPLSTQLTDLKDVT